MQFQNLDELLDRHSPTLRKAALQIAQAGIQKAIPYDAVKKLITRTESRITIGDLELDCSKVKKIYVVGAGKGSFPIAQALDEIFDGMIEKGVVVVKEGEKRRLRNIGVFESSHPSIFSVRRRKAIWYLLPLRGDLPRW